MRRKCNRRGGRRRECLVPVEGKRGSAFDKVQTIDIGNGGIGFVSQKAIAIDKKIAIELDLGPDRASVLVVGKVKWARKIEDSDSYRIGVEFTKELLAHSRNRLRQYLPE